MLLLLIAILKARALYPPGGQDGIRRNLIILEHQCDKLILMDGEI